MSILGLLGALLLVGGCNSEKSVLPVYSLEQKDSVHPGYRHTDLTSSKAAYVNDYEEYGLELDNPDPTDVIALWNLGGNVCLIPGQSPDAFIAVDCGSEMPAFEVFRNTQHPAFAWRTATFGKMVNGALLGPAAHKETTDAALITDVVSTLKDGARTTPPGFDPKDYKKITGLYLYNDQLAGMRFNVNVYTGGDGEIYLGEKRDGGLWTQASPAITQWLQTK